MTKYWALSIALLAPAALLAQRNTSHKLSPELRGEGAHQGSIHVIVQFKRSLNLSHEEKNPWKGRYSGRQTRHHKRRGRDLARQRPGNVSQR